MTRRSITVQKTVFAGFVFVFGLPTTGALAEQNRPTPELIEFYNSCSTAAETSVLSSEEAMQCGLAYHTIKLSFLGDNERQVFQDVSLSERAALLKKAYGAFVAWRIQQTGATAGL